MAGIFLLLNNDINAGVVYTNIDPDTTIFNNNSIYQLDIDADADVDFTFFNNNISSPGFYSYSGNYYPPHFKQKFLLHHLQVEVLQSVSPILIHFQIFTIFLLL
ncbi:MAG: hypothetical protein IPL12_14665 [Bacteroidetes bacterium]|nr:hypothetical protein [Bacteroidota bacterium]